MATMYYRPYTSEVSGWPVFLPAVYLVAHCDQLEVDCTGDRFRISFCLSVQLAYYDVRLGTKGNSQFSLQVQSSTSLSVKVQYLSLISIK